MKQVLAGGHAVGSHTWSHADLSKKSVQEAKDEIEKGFSAVKWAAGAPTHPISVFRRCGITRASSLISGSAMWRSSRRLRFVRLQDAQTRAGPPGGHGEAQEVRKGIVLMHDFQQATAGAAAELLNDLKAGGYKVVFMKPKGTLTTIASYDEAILKDAKLRPSATARPRASCVPSANSFCLSTSRGRRAQSLYCAIPATGRADPIDEACLRNGAIKRLRPTALQRTIHEIGGLLLARPFSFADPIND